MGATPEVVVEDQDELAAALGTTKDTGAVKDPEPEPEPETEKKEEEVTGEEKTEEKPEGKKEEVEDDGLFDVKEQNRELRQILRQQKREMSLLNAKLLRLEKRSTEATKKAEDEGADEETLFGRKREAEKPAEPADDLSPVEKVQVELANLAKAKGPILETLLETMELNTNYADVRDVCSQANFDDIFEAIGDSVAAKDPSKDSAIAALEAEAAVWRMANPYKYMYGLIKQYHPKYAARQPQKGKDPVDAGKAKPKEPAKAPASLANVPGKGSSANAWTAARIDEMDETELDKVPVDVYDKYLRGELD